MTSAHVSFRPAAAVGPSGPAAESAAEDPTLPDARFQAAAVKGRGTAVQWAHRFEGWQRQRVDDGWSAQNPEPDDPACSQPVATQLTMQTARSIVSRNDSPDVPFELAVNPYRGCEHGCIYCYARPTHSYLNLSPGLDFETRIFGKANAAELLRRELAKPGHVVSPINLGSATDPYQPVERQAGLTRQLIEVLDQAHHPYTIVTKSGLVTRDIDLLQRAARRRQVYVMLSVTTLDGGLARVLEPRASSALKRLQAVRALADAGVPVGVNVAPIIPFVNEPEIEAIVAAAAAAGARSVHYTVLRLPWEVRPLFEDWLRVHRPLQARRILARLEDLGGGEVYSARFNDRMKGRGIWGELIAQRMRQAAARHGLSQQAPELSTEGFAVPPAWRLRRGPEAGADGAAHERGARAVATESAQQSLF